MGITPTDQTFIVLAHDGRHVNLGHFEPTADEVAAASEQLKNLGLAGWLCRMSGSYTGPARRLSIEATNAGQLGAAVHGASFMRAEEAFFAAHAASRGR